MALAEVKELYDTNFRAVPASLRALADEIERGDFGEVGCCAVVILGSELSVFGMGPESESPSVHFLLCAGANQLQQTALEHGKSR